MHRNKNNIFTHFKIQYKKKIISFYKISINFPYLKEALKNLGEIILRVYSPLHIISNTIITIFYLPKNINLTILKIFYLVLKILTNFLCQYY